MMTDSNPKSTFNSPLFAKLAQVLILIAISSYLCSSIHYPEFFEHLTKGNWILANGELPGTYLWTLVGSQLEWADPNWLFEVGVSFVETQFGIKGLVLTKLLLCIFVLISFSSLFSYLAKDLFFGTSLSILVSCGILFHSPFLPMLAAWSLLAGILLQACKFKDAEKLLSKDLLFIFILAVIYANTHGSFIACTLFVFILVSLNKQKRLALFLVLLLAAVFSPYFGVQILTSLKTGWNHFYLDVVLQREPANIYNFTLAFVVLLWLIFALFWHYVPKAVSLGPILLVGFLTLAGLGASFVLPFALFILGFVISIVWSDGGYQNKKNLGEAIHKFKTMLSGITAMGGLWFLSCLCAVNIINQYRSPESKTLLPNNEVEFMIERGIKEPLFHEGFIGGYLVYRFSDEKGEPRNNVMHSSYSMQLYPKAAVADHSLSSLGEDWREGFKAYAPNTVLCRASSPLYQFLFENPEWKLLVSGKKSERRDLKNNPFIWSVFERIEAFNR